MTIALFVGCAVWHTEPVWVGTMTPPQGAIVGASKTWEWCGTDWEGLGTALREVEAGERYCDVVEVVLDVRVAPGRQCWYVSGRPVRCP